MRCSSAASLVAFARLGRALQTGALIVTATVVAPVHVCGQTSASQPLPVSVNPMTPLALAAPVASQADAAGPVDRLTLAQALRYAVDHYPSVRAAIEQVSASAAGVDVARANFLPRLDSIWQSNRATANNIFGQLLPQSVIPSLSGPVLP